MDIEENIKWRKSLVDEYIRYITKLREQNEKKRSKKIKTQ
jgi:hypothetical protein